jgi:hypothetical protein
MGMAPRELDGSDLSLGSRNGLAALDRLSTIVLAKAEPQDRPILSKSARAFAFPTFSRVMSTAAMVV